VVVAATNSREPVLARAWLKPGAHVNAVGASTPQAREIDTATVAASALFGLAALFRLLVVLHLGMAGHLEQHASHWANNPSRITGKAQI
jgi:hypothetical protein